MERALTSLGTNPVTAAVRRLYETHPYPRYPLLATPRWQDGYASTSVFACALYKNENSRASQSSLIAGCGEIFPYVMRRWEPRSSALTCIDLSRQSLIRARLRLALTFKPVKYEHADLDTYLDGAGPAFDHVDAYGVVHHLPDPGRTLKALAARLVPGGTMRLMVYNSAARTWIHGVQRLLNLCGFDAARRGDVDAARGLLRRLAPHLPALAHRLGQIGAATIANDARFADTFLHPREARMGVALWFERISAAGLTPVGLFDRYGELDDLDNPLWAVPSVEALAERAADERFENNLELFLVKELKVLLGALPEKKVLAPFPREGDDRQNHSRNSPLPWGREPKPFFPGERTRPPFILQFKQPPSSWFRYRETSNLSFATRRRLWLGFLGALSGRAEVLTQRELASIPTPALQRLARIGAILPAQLPATALAIAAAPMCAAMDKPQAPPRGAPINDQCEQILRQVMLDRGITDERRVTSALRRIAAIG